MRQHAVIMRTALLALVLACSVATFASASPEGEERSLEVTATAYNSVPSQTNAEPWVAAWGDSLANGMKVIAVSRDLLELGLRRGTVVRIDGLPDDYVVLDKMNKRWTRTIDVYMGDDISAAREFGRRGVTIRWAGGTPLASVSAGPTASAGE
jgi:3D (Asp-Asp-Asp) domain-containing protein